MPNKFIVFCYHRAVIDAVTELLAKRNVKYVRIAGDVPPEVRAVSNLKLLRTLCFPFSFACVQIWKHHSGRRALDSVFDRTIMRKKLFLTSIL